MLAARWSLDASLDVAKMGADAQAKQEIGMHSTSEQQAETRVTLEDSHLDTVSILSLLSESGFIIFLEISKEIT